MTAQPSKPLISLHQAGYAKNGRSMVHNVDLTVHTGEIVTLLGPNGSGKSTTVKMALGLRTPTTGKSWQRQGLRIGYVPQKLSLDSTIPLRVSRFMRLTENLDQNSILEALQQTHTEHLIESDIHVLSGGEFQRILLARAFARKPELLVLDEPVQGVDFTGEIEIYRLISAIRDRLNCGILLISHNLHVVMKATNKVICLNGHVCCAGNPQEVITNPAYQNLFGSHAAQTLALYHHHHDHTHDHNGEIVSQKGSPNDI